MIHSVSTTSIVNVVLFVTQKIVRLETHFPNCKPGLVMFIDWIIKDINGLQEEKEKKTVLHVRTKKRSSGNNEKEKSAFIISLSILFYVKL